MTTNQTHQMSKREIRQALRELHLGNEDGLFYLAELRGAAERSELEMIRNGVSVEEAHEEAAWGLANNLRQGAERRLNLHDDPGSAEQMHFCADVVMAHGVRGLAF